MHYTTAPLLCTVKRTFGTRNVISWHNTWVDSKVRQEVLIQMIKTDHSEASLSGVTV